MATPSLMSLHLTAQRERLDNPEELLPIDEGTGFVVAWEETNYLVTNRHVVTGRGRDGRPLGSAALPSSLLTWIPAFSAGRPDVIAWVANSLSLYSEAGEAEWLVHREFGERVDVVAIPLPDTTSLNQSPGFTTTFLPYSLRDPDGGPTDLRPTSDVSIVGFPFGHSAGGKAAIWSRGAVASEPTLDFENEPCFLIDARTRPGQSGSPVIGYWSSQRVTRDGTARFGTGEGWELFGVYSGLIDGRTDIGRVWRREAIEQIIVHGVRDALLFE